MVWQEVRYWSVPLASCYASVADTFLSPKTWLVVPWFVFVTWRKVDNLFFWIFLNFQGDELLIINLQCYIDVKLFQD